MVKPLLKWVGGKTQILEDVLSRFPLEMSEYCEPFVGGGSVLLGFLTRVRDGRIRVGRITACDAIPWLMMLYTCVRDDAEVFLRECAVIQNEYDSCTEMKGDRKPTCLQEALCSKESYYYWTRARFNAEREGAGCGTGEEQAKIAAMFVFLNKMGFRGLYREGPRGYNVPFGNYKKPRLVDEDNVREVSRLFRDAEVVFRCCNFREALHEVASGSFVYMDPPYVPETATSFVGYVDGGFRGEDHRDLFEAARGLRERGVGFLMSNSGVPLVREAFPVSEGFVVGDVEARRAIHSRNPGARTVEVLIGSP